MPEYQERDLMELDKVGNHYSKHVLAMTREDLRSKSDIAAELGYRDMVIDKLTEENKRLRESLEKIQRMQSRTPELPEDYTHEDVGDLNDRIDEVFGIVNTALSELGGEKDAQLK
ncbi:hypothetical protein ABC295_000972 [Vibrio cholerae]